MIRRLQKTSVRRALPGLLSLVLLALCGIGASPAGAGPEGGCEPAGPVDLRARVVSEKISGADVRLLVQVAIEPHVNVPEATLGLRRLDASGRRLRREVPARRLPLVAGIRREFVYEVLLARGEDHHLLFTLDAPAGNAGPVATSASLRVNLDPARQGVRTGDVLQFRARPASR